MREKIITGNVYHVLNRGVDKRKIFLDDKDHYRFIHDLYEFNDINSVNNITHKFRNMDYKDSGSPYNSKIREPLVDILAFCLMPNHYHLLIKPRFDDSLVKFMTRLNMGYAKYFNEKYERKGVLFEGRYKLVPVADERHFIHIPYYIHLNPLDFIMPEWRERKVTNYKKAIDFLEHYKWSSHIDYVGYKNFPSLTSRKFLLDVFGGHQKYKEDMEEWIKNFESYQFGNLILD